MLATLSDSQLQSNIHDPSIAPLKRRIFSKELKRRSRSLEGDDEDNNQQALKRAREEEEGGHNPNSTTPAPDDDDWTHWLLPFEAPARALQLRVSELGALEDDDKLAPTKDIIDLRRDIVELTASVKFPSSPSVPVDPTLQARYWDLVELLSDLANTSAFYLHRMEQTAAHRDLVAIHGRKRADRIRTARKTVKTANENLPYLARQLANVRATLNQLPAESIKELRDRQKKKMVRYSVAKFRSKSEGVRLLSDYYSKLESDLLREGWSTLCALFEGSRLLHSLTHSDSDSNTTFDTAANANYRHLFGPSSSSSLN